jgi:NAD-dependent SIR2 family protein deacetylase
MKYHGLLRIDLTAKIAVLKTAIDQADAIIIGAGAGLSAAAGLSYDNTDTFNTLFPGYHDRYGLKAIIEADFYPFPTPEEQYALLDQVYRRHTLYLSTRKTLPRFTPHNQR